ncbi:Protein S-acyltransferase [Handroanthus impetiginosus]|uniref:Protein S-acyltransferase n=1 Tax=Handroanthus impetiginosus TaxID=429701 RepID=A0A2G9FXG4_9LAMI|nr:Protein S-acyltransferase [Handroanthus impetiginosus]
MYVVPPPNRSDPLSGSTNGSDELRIYQTWKGSNKFFLQGRFIFGPDVRSLALTIFLIVAPVTVFCVFVAGKLMDDFTNHWGTSIMVIAVVFTFYVCASSDVFHYQIPPVSIPLSLFRCFRNTLLLSLDEFCL